MAYDIYGNDLKRGHCEVHPEVAEEYPCFVCISERDKNNGRNENISLLEDNYMMFQILNDIKSKCFSDNQGNYICNIPKELKIMIDNICEVTK